MGGMEPFFLAAVYNCSSAISPVQILLPKALLENSRMLPELLLFTGQSLSKKKCHFFFFFFYNGTIYQPWDWVESQMWRWHHCMAYYPWSFISWCNSVRPQSWAASQKEQWGDWQKFQSLSASWKTVPKCRQWSYHLKKAQCNMIHPVTTISPSSKAIHKVCLSIVPG